MWEYSWELSASVFSGLFRGLGPALDISWWEIPLEIWVEPKRGSGEKEEGGRIWAIKRIFDRGRIREDSGLNSRMEENFSRTQRRNYRKRNDQRKSSQKSEKSIQ